MPRGKRLVDLATGLLLLAVALVAFQIGSQYRSGSETLPMLACAGLGSAALVIIVRCFFGREYEFEDSGSGSVSVPLWIVVGLMASIIGFAVGVTAIGYVTTSLIYLPVVAYLLGLRSILWLALGPLAFVGISYWLFVKVFLIPLPLEIITRLWSA